MSGKLFLVPTPIGNLGDMTFRAVETLKSVDLIAAEDTRNSIKLLNHFDIHVPMTSYHEYNKYDKGQILKDKLLEGTNIALITDAGMPGISDPGEELVRMCAEAGIEVTALPGACACVTALTVSGLSTRRFCFEGFLPQGKDGDSRREQRAVLERLKTETRTTVFYEAPHRLLRTLQMLETATAGTGAGGESRRVTICRELTKKHETIFRGSLAEALEYYRKNDPKGEICIVLEGVSQESLDEKERLCWNEIPVEEHMQMYLARGLNKKEAMKCVASDRGVPKKEIYRYLIDHPGKLP